jgi:hypothetical protein
LVNRLARLEHRHEFRPPRASRPQAMLGMRELDIAALRSAADWVATT